MNDDDSISDEERSLFRREIGEVTPLRHDGVEPQRTLPPPRPVQTRLDEARVLSELLSSHPEAIELETGDELWFARPGLRPKTLRKLRRGQFSVGAELDLHGMTVPQAREAIVGFLAWAGTRRSRCVRIIHGKGRGSKAGPVLKQQVFRWLQRWDGVLALCSARPVDGGTGAIYVLLREKR